MSTVQERAGQRPPTPTEEHYLAVQQAPEFQELRRRYRGWVLPVTGLFLGWYFVYVLLADYAPDFMGFKLVGNFTLGLVLGLLQFASTFVITTLYVRHADRVLDPRAEQIRTEMEEGLL